MGQIYGFYDDLVTISIITKIYVSLSLFNPILIFKYSIKWNLNDLEGNIE